MTTLDPAPQPQPFEPGYEPVLRRLGLRLLGNPADADDVTQEALIASYLYDGNVVRDQRSWLHGVTRNLALQRVRSERRRREVERKPARARWAPSADTEVAAEELACELSRELDRLPAAQARALRGRYLQELSYDALADEEGVPSATIRTRVRRGLTSLRERVDPKLLDHLPAWLVLDFKRLGGDLGALAPEAAAVATGSSTTGLAWWWLASPLLMGVLTLVTLPNLIFGDIGRPEALSWQPIEADQLTLEALDPITAATVRELSPVPTPEAPVPVLVPRTSRPRLDVELAAQPGTDLSQAKAWIVEGASPAFYSGIEAVGPPHYVANELGNLQLPELVSGQALLVRAPGGFALLGPPKDERWESYAWLPEREGQSEGWTGPHGLTLRPAIDLFVRVVDEEGAVLPESSIEVFGKQLTHRCGQVDGMGEVVLRDLPLGVDLSFSVQAPGAGTRILGPLSVDRDPGFLEIVLPRERRITGRILGRDGRPCPGAQLALQTTGSEELAPLRPVADRLPGARRSIRSAADVVTDHLGRFEIRGLGPGEYYLGASKKSMQGELTVDIGEDDADVELQILPPEPRLDWKVDVGAARLEAGLPFDVYASRVVDDFGWREWQGAKEVNSSSARFQGLVPGAWIVQAVPVQSPGSFWVGWTADGTQEIQLDRGNESLEIAQVKVLGGAASELGLYREDGSPVVLRVGRERWSSRVQLEGGLSARLEVPEVPLRAIVPGEQGGTYFVVEADRASDGLLVVDLSRGELHREVRLERPELDSEREAVVAMAWSARGGDVQEWIRGEADDGLMRPLLFEAVPQRRPGPPTWRLRGLASSELGRGSFLVPEGEGSLLLVEESGRRTHEVVDHGPVRIDWR